MNLPRAQRRQLIANATKVVAEVVNDGHLLIIVSLGPDGPKIQSSYGDELTLRLLRLVMDQVDWPALSEPDAGRLEALQ